MESGERQQRTRPAEAAPLECGAPEPELKFTESERAREGGQMLLCPWPDWIYTRKVTTARTEGGRLPQAPLGDRLNL